MTRAISDDNGADISEESNAADASRSGIRGPSRTNSGIAVEEGRARAALAERVRSDLGTQSPQEALGNS